jgi:cell division septum initiation protein DivIVA
MSINAEKYDAPYAGNVARIGDTTEHPVTAPASQAAARLLELAARETDQWREEARNEAAAIVAEAREESDRIVRAAREESAKIVRTAREEGERVVSAAQEKGAELTNDARVEAYRVRAETTELRKRHEDDIARLEQVATEHREGLRSHLTEMLARVDAAPGESNR